MNSVHPSDRKFVKKSFDQASEGKFCRINYRIILSDGPEHIVYDRAEVFFDEINRVIRIIGTAPDITERKKTEEALRESEEKVRNILSSSPNAITVTDLNGTIIECNQATLDRGGFSSKGEVIGKSAFDFIAAKDHQRALENMEKTLKEGSVKNVEYTFLAKDGTEYPAELSASVIRDSAGRPASFVATIKDITEQKKLEEKLREYQEYIEELVQKRTAKLKETLEDLEKEMVQRKKAEGLIKGQNGRLKELDRRKSEFLSTAAHELRTPLTSILGFSEILLKGKLDTKKKNKFLKTINEEAEGLAYIINDLLDVSRIESGRGIEIKKAPVDLKDIIPENVNFFQVQTNKHIFKIDLPGNLPKIELDKDRIGQVIGNLLSNAIKFSPQGGEIRINLEQTDEEIKISVSDTGLGIPKKDLPYVFEKFYRADNASSNAIGGTGLGLAIAKYIVESHKGKIWVESKPGKGSSFSFTLPLKATERKEEIE